MLAIWNVADPNIWKCRRDRHQRFVRPDEERESLMSYPVQDQYADIRKDWMAALIR